MIHDLAHFIRELARDFYIVPLYGLIWWYAGSLTADAALVFFFIGMYEGRTHALKQVTKPEGDFL